LRESDFDVGLKIRRAVLGDDYVESALKNADEFSRPFQELTTEYCWGRVWSRAGLSLRDRSLLNIAMLVALNRPRELRLHLKGALRNGCSLEEIREVLLQATIYCGVAAAATAFDITRKAIREFERGDIEGGSVGGSVDGGEQ